MANVVVYKMNNQRSMQIPVDTKLNTLFEYYWSVSWDFPEGESFKQQVVREPKADIYFDYEKQLWFISKVDKQLFEINLEKSGSVFGIKLKPGSQYIIKSVFMEFPNLPDSFEQAVEIMNNYLTNLKLEATDEGLLINKIVNYIKTNKHIYSVTDIADEFKTPIRTLQRLFKKYLGLTIKWTISRYRFMEAIESVKTENKNWSDLAIKLDYSDQAHFIRDFKSHLGITPNQYYNIFNTSQNQS